MRQVTELLILIVVVGALLYDLFAYLKGGNDATISKITLDAEKDWPIIAFLMGLLMGHLTWPQTRS